ncbi:hypothetical protein [Salipiger marinus]|uniref:hypothetical protein n=1 Tax=Salipiger marinus TaxID=555512 RepID=UPI00405968DD
MQGHAFDRGFPISSALLFSADDGTGFEPWLTNVSGTTAALIDLFPGSNTSISRVFDTLGGKLFFQADDGTVGRELFVSDGTVAGTDPISGMAGDDRLNGDNGTGTDSITGVTFDLV